MSQMDLFGGATPTDELDWPASLRYLSTIERERGIRLDAAEAGALLHYRRQKHSAELRCKYCPIDGAEALGRLRDRRPLEETGGPETEETSSRLADTQGPVSSSGPVAGDERRSEPPAARSTDPEPPLPDPGDDRRGFAHGPASNAPETERRAAARILPASGTARLAVLHEIALAGPDGRTDEELALNLEMRHYTAAPRRKELVDDGWARDSGERRPTTTGSLAAVWVLTDEGKRDLEMAFRKEYDPEPDL